MALPSVTFSKSDVVIGHTSILQLISTGGSPTTTNLRCKVLDYDGSNEKLRVKFPTAADGVKRTRRVRRIAASEMLVLEISEWKKLVTLLGGKLVDCVEMTSAQLWVLDQDDASGSVAMKTDAFACSIYLEDGKKRFEAAGGDDAGTKGVLIVESIKDGDITFTNDASA